MSFPHLKKYLQQVNTSFFPLCNWSSVSVGKIVDPAAGLGKNMGTTLLRVKSAGPGIFHAQWATYCCGALIGNAAGDPGAAGWWVWICNQFWISPNMESGPEWSILKGKR